MSLQKIGKYTEIFESSRQLQRPTEFDTKRVLLIQNIAIAGLIEAGAPYTAEKGEIIIDTGIDYKRVFINDIYPYLSPEAQMKVMVANAKMFELPAPQGVNYSAPQNTSSSAMQQDEIRTFTSEGVRKEEIRKEPMKMMDGLEDYDDSETKIEDEIETLEESVQEDELINKKWENVNRQTDAAPVQQTAAEEPVTAYVEELNNINKSETSLESVPVQDSPEPINNMEQKSEEKEESEHPEADVIELSKHGITYERCNLEIIKADGNIARFSVHAAPLKGNNWDVIIVRLKQTGENGGYIHTECGIEPEFVYGDILLKVKKNMKNDEVFSCDFYSSDPSVRINKINVENGGKQGNLVIFDENLELRIYPFPNVRNRTTGKMEFGNNKKGEAAFLYYIKNGDEVIASSGAERPAQFEYEGENIAIRAKWDKDKVIVGAEVIQ